MYINPYIYITIYIYFKPQYLEPYKSISIPVTSLTPEGFRQPGGVTRGGTLLGAAQVRVGETMRISMGFLCDLTRENSDLTRENGDFTRENEDFMGLTNRNGWIYSRWWI